MLEEVIEEEVRVGSREGGKGRFSRIINQDISLRILGALRGFQQMNDIAKLSSEVRRSRHTGNNLR